MSFFRNWIMSVSSLYQFVEFDITYKITMKICLNN